MINQNTDQAMRALAERGRLPEAPPGAYERPWLTTDVPPWVAPTHRKPTPVWATLVTAVGLVLLIWAVVMGLVAWALDTTG